MSEWVSAGKVRMTPKGAHDSTLAYDVLDVVSNEDNTKLYIAKQDVPATILLSNTNYWELIISVEDTVITTDRENFKASLVNILRHVIYSTDSGNAMLKALCSSVNINGWIDLYRNKSIDSNGDVVSYPNGTRCASDYITIAENSVYFTCAFESDAPKYAVCCYDSEHEYLGRATDYNGGTGAISGLNKRWFVNNTVYIRLLCVDESLSNNIIDEYANRMVTIVFDDNTVNAQKYVFTEAMP